MTPGKPCFATSYVFELTLRRFARKFELVSFWAALQDVLPPAWDPSVHVAAFDVLFGRSGNRAALFSSTPVVKCPNILPAILSALDFGLKRMLGQDHSPLTPNPSGAQFTSSFGHPAKLSSLCVALLSPQSTNDSYAEVLAEELIELHSVSPSFRSAFQSKPVTGQFIRAARSFIGRVTESDQLRNRAVRVSEKITHLALMLALDNSVDQHQKDQVSRVSVHS